MLYESVFCSAQDIDVLEVLFFILAFNCASCNVALAVSVFVSGLCVFVYQFIDATKVRQLSFSFTAHMLPKSFCLFERYEILRCGTTTKDTQGLVLGSRSARLQASLRKGLLGLRVAPEVCFEDVCFGGTEDVRHNEFSRLLRA